MIQIRLEDTARQELNRRAQAPDIKPRTRTRLEMVRLSDAGWSIPKIARHFGLSQRCVRQWIKAYLTGGFDALRDQPHVGQTSKLTPEDLAALRDEVSKGERTWTAPQIAEWLAQERGVQLSVDWLRPLLRRAKLSYQRTSRSLKHQQKPEAVAEKTADLQTLEKGGRRG